MHATRRTFWLAMILAGVFASVSSAADAPTTAPSISDPHFALGEKLFSDPFDDGKNWITELEQGGKVTFDHGTLDIDVSRGATVWFKPIIHGPVLIEYLATVISSGGKNDRVSDLNCFWMAHDARNMDDLFAVPRTGKFADYNQLACYYVGLGGNTNTTTRFRRYIGDTTSRPILPVNDLSDKQFMITPNVSQWITLVADDHLIQFYRDGKKYFEMNDPEPYTSGNFAFRTTQNHMTVRDFAVYRLRSNP